MRRSIVLLGSLLALAACVPPPVVLGPGANPYPAEPPLQAEMRPPPPVSEDQLVWHMGDWDWVGSGYVWRPGEWETLGAHSTQYLPGHWIVLNGAWAWERGHWL